MVLSRRLNERISLHAPISWRIRGEKETNNSLTENISIGGLRFSAQQFIVPQTKLMLEINILSFVLRPIARVVWSAHLLRSDMVQTGIEFIQINDKEKNFLREFIALNLSK